MATTQTVIIDFQADLSSLSTAIDTLTELGIVDKELADTFKKTNAEVVKQGNALDTAAKKTQSTARTFSSLSDLMKQFPKSGLNRFLLQIGNDLANAGIDASDFFKKMKDGVDDTEPKVKSLRQELRQIKEQMIEAALSGDVLGEEYLRLKKRAGELDDTIKDVANDIANAGSDTRGIDNVVGSITALAGGFSAVQGAAALFGNETEDLQKALLKVNAAMALATGLQQVSNALQKEGALARVADTAATYGQIAVQKIYTFVTGQSTKATLGFKIALAATGIGAITLLVLTFITALKSQNTVLENTNKILEDQKKAYDNLSGAIDLSTRNRVAAAEAAGKGEEEVARITEAGIIKRKAALQANNAELVKQRDNVNGVIKAFDRIGASSKDLTKSYNTLNDAIGENNKQLAELQTQQNELNSKETVRLNEEKKKADEEALARSKENSEKAIAAAKKQRAAEFADFKAGVELQLLAAEEGSVKQLELRKKLLLQELQIALENEDLTNNQRKLLIQEFFKERKALQTKYEVELSASALEDQKNRLSAELENLNLNEEDKLSAKISFLQISAAEEIAAAEGNALKIKAINAKLNTDITTAKVESIRKQADFEAALLSAQGGPAKRALEATAANERLKADIRINSIRQLQQLDIDAIDKQIAANRMASEIIGSDQQSLNLEYQQLLDQKAAATEATEKKITDITLSESQKRRDNDIAYIQATIQGLGEVSSIIAGIQANQQEVSDAAIEQQRRKVDELLEAGAITEKEAKARNKRIDAEERATKNRAAQQQKNLAVFNAFLAIPQAFIAGLTAPFPIGGPIYGAILASLAAVQAGVIAARPVPKFATGKKGSYSGLGEVGEAGAELIHRADGSMEVATKRSLVYLGAKDKVFTASETRQMMPFVNKEAINAKGPRETFDYDKLAKAVKQKQAPGTVVNIDKEFISESVADGISKANYFDRYYSSK